MPDINPLQPLMGDVLDEQCRLRGLDPNKIQYGPISGVRYGGASSSYWPCLIDCTILDAWKREVGENLRWGID